MNSDGAHVNLVSVDLIREVDTIKQPSTTMYNQHILE